MVDWRDERDQALLVLARERRPESRAVAADLLVQLATEDETRRQECAELVPRLLADAQDLVRRRGVALAAAILPDDEAERVLGQALADSSDNVRIEAAGQLADRGKAELRGVLAAALEDEAFPVRFEAARGMAALRHSAGLQVLIEALDQTDFRFRALGALAELENPEALPAVKRLFKRWVLPAFERTQAAGVLAKLGDPEGGEYLVRRTRVRRWAMDRAHAIELCGEVKASGAFDRLAELLLDPDDDARGAAARGLGRLGEARAVPFLKKVLEDEGLPEDLRLDAAEGLAMLGTPEARKLVESALDGFGSAEARAELTELLEEHR